MGPMGLQCDKLQTDDMNHYRQPLQERHRGHGKTGNVPTTNRFKEERTHKLITCQKDTQEDSDISPLLCCSDFCIPTTENAKAGCIAGSEASGRTMHVPGMSVAGLCARFAPTIKWHRIALWGPHFGLHVLQNNKMGVFLKSSNVLYLFRQSN